MTSNLSTPALKFITLTDTKQVHGLFDGPIDQTYRVLVQTKATVRAVFLQVETEGSVVHGLAGGRYWVQV